MKILSIDDMLEAARECNLPEYDGCVAEIEAAATELAELLAARFNLETHGATWEGKDFAGCCAAFKSADGKPVSDEADKIIGEKDTGGDWE